MDFSDWVRQVLEDDLFMSRYWFDHEPRTIVVQENSETFVNRNKIIRAIEE
ncbi:hypothetical protein SEA_ASHTON_23 [Microbacterium phage Ashton]|uniref:Uncharacterized protein n=1 Tax=Microbacterium phage Ashton TaxID=2562366 RepID=A0A6M3T371_9CAUD|nr:hypothetical protein SEA_ASHTON_23 [Microbacterium phage Ashton]